MLTFETLSRIAREEKASQHLTKLPEGFFEEVASYITKKTQATQGREDGWELENARLVLGDITKARERKILTAALTFVDSGMETPNLAPEEKKLFDSAASLVMQFRTERKRFLEPGTARNSMVAFLEDVPQFVGTDMKNHGPFRKGDIANLPEDAARLLIEKGAAEPIGQGEKPVQDSEAPA